MLNLHGVVGFLEQVSIAKVFEGPQRAGLEAERDARARPWEWPCVCAHACQSDLEPLLIFYALFFVFIY